ncbi:MAG: M81 family metallopeptidase [Saprospiraceae bacterium]|nr:M81 family metallopeptidase [Saprospiraceae bacterium]
MVSNGKGWRIGILGIYHESNTFIDQKTTRKDFEDGHLFFRAAIVEEYQHAFHEIGGMIETLRQNPVQILPLMYAEATPGGIIRTDAARYLIENLKEVLGNVGRLDGLLLAPHGAAVAENEDDFDGYWLSVVRDLFPSIPIVGTLDPHANVSQKMVDKVDAFIAYKTNPHVDQRSVGMEAAQLLLDTLNKRIKPLQKLQSSRVAISIEQQYTAEKPCLDLYALAQSLENEKGILSISILLGFPYADVAEMGSAFIVVTDNDAELAGGALHKLELFFHQNHQKFNGEKISINQALEMIPPLPKPVLLLDMGDNVGGGSPGDSTFLLHALEGIEHCKSFVCIKDPDAVKLLEQHQPGDRIWLDIGGKSDDQHGTPLTSEVKLRAIISGGFMEREPRHGGQVHFDMGRTAIVETPNDTTIMVTTLRTVPFSLQQLLHCNIKPQEYDVIVAKGVQAPIAAYAPVCPSIIRVNTQGVTTADVRQLTYRKRRRPLFPFEALNTTQE